MKEETKKISMQLSNDEFKHEESFTKKFEFMGHSLAHENQLQMLSVEESTDNLLVKNHLASLIGDTIFKTTQIQFQNKLIRIVDNFTCSPLSEERILSQQVEIVQKESQLPRHKKLLGGRTFKNLLSEGQDEKKGRDTKNVVKNIFRLFQNWVGEHSHQQLEIGSALEQLLRKNGKYNNTLIILLSQNLLLREAFKTFSSTSGEQYINKSRIQDKQSHLEALRRYETICWSQGSEEKGVKKGESSSEDKNELKECNNIDQILEKGIICYNN